MQLTCTHCHTIIKSLLIDSEKALTEVSNLFSAHLSQHHQDKLREMVKDLASLQATSYWIAIIAKHSTLLDLPFESNPLTDKFDQAIDHIEECLGVEIVGLGDMEVGQLPATFSPDPSVPSPAD